MSLTASLRVATYGMEERKGGLAGAGACVEVVPGAGDADPMRAVGGGDEVEGGGSIAMRLECFGTSSSENAFCCSVCRMVSNAAMLAMLMMDRLQEQIIPLIFTAPDGYDSHEL